MSAESTPSVMDQIVALAKRRGFVYPASDIYGGIRGFWDYGPLGVLLKNNIRDHWWNWMVECPPIGPDGEVVDMVGLDSAIIQHPKTWQASGHVAGFNDPMVDDTETKQRFRADKVFTVGFFTQQQLESVAQKELTAKLFDFLNGNLSLADYQQFEKEHIADFAGDFDPALRIGVEADSELSAPEAAYSKLTKNQRKYLGWPSLIEEKFRERFGQAFVDRPSNFMHLLEAWQFLRVWGFYKNPKNRQIISPGSQKPTLTEPRQFNLMLD
ncbi:MAG: hypothetical protein ACTHM6_05620, partial [Tepidisphaeraceae bacterium]